ncbi:MAG: hypothetical protein C0625_09560 [Arcobacter sp.]|nr:MAG: hypothetical protein C0625_09560 [Arcobacter sp.]
MKILIIKNDGLGDLILSSGLISHIAEHFSTSLDLITCKQNKEIAQAIKGINKTYFISRDYIKQYSLHNKDRIKVPFKRAIDTTKIVRLNKEDEKTIDYANKNNYDLIIVLRRYIRQSSLFLLNKINSKCKLCMWEFPTNLSYSLAKQLNKNALHLTSINLNSYIRPELEYYEAILSKYFKEKIYANPKLNYKKTIIKKEQKTIAIIISGSSIKISTPNWIKICNFLLERNYSITLLGGKEEEKQSFEITAIDNRIINKVGLYTFNEYSKILSNFEVIVGNDTGLSHFASIYNDNILIILGGGTYGSFFPWREDKLSCQQHITFKKLDCYYCLWNCTNSSRNACITELFDTNQILNDLENFLNLSTH